MAEHECVKCGNEVKIVDTLCESCEWFPSDSATTLEGD